jgi:hypothetical protein
MRRRFPPEADLALGDGLALGDRFRFIPALARRGALAQGGHGGQLGDRGTLAGVLANRTAPLASRFMYRPPLA